MTLQNKILMFIRSRPILTYFSSAFLLSYGGYCIIFLIRLFHKQQIQSFDALLLFPIIVIGVGITGILFTWLVDGKTGLQNLFLRMKRWRIPVRWYGILLIPPFLITIILLCMQKFVSPTYALKFFPLGITFGLVAGFFEEIGWTGFLYPKMKKKYSALSASIILGVLWGLWHAPVVDYLGAATPHGNYWLAFFCAFIAIIAALRVLICWVYNRTKSIIIPQLLHASNTGFLVVLSPARLSPANETAWYAIYGCILCIIVAFIVIKYNKEPSM